MNEVFGFLEASWLGRTVGQSLMLTAILSGIHVLGFTVATGGALIANLRRLGIVLVQQPAAQITATASRIVLLGLVVSIATGALLFSARAMAAAANPFFQVKMLLLAAAATFHFTAQRWADARPPSNAKIEVAAGAVGFALWSALALAACAFILLE